jgi:hypothetical protein
MGLRMILQYCILHPTDFGYLGWDQHSAHVTCRQWLHKFLKLRTVVATSVITPSKNDMHASPTAKIGQWFGSIDHGE